MKQELLGAVKLLDYESCCTEKWLVSYYDTNHFFADVELKSANGISSWPDDDEE